MSYKLNKKIVDLVPYEPISGTYKIRLDANECPTDLPEDIKAQLKAAIDALPFNRYPDPLATGVIKAFSDFYGIDPELVTAGNGSDELIFLIESAFLEKGDKMLVVSPDFSMYNFYSSICEVECDTFFKNDSLDIDVDALIAKINADNIKLLIFSNPCNPTGAIMEREDIAVILMTEKLVSLCPDIVYDLKLNRKKPLIVEIPDRHGNGRTKDSITKYVQDAIGVKL